MKNKMSVLIAGLLFALVVIGVVGATNAYAQSRPGTLLHGGGPGGGRGFGLEGLQVAAEALNMTTDELINAFAQGNPDMGRPTRYERVSVNGRPSLRTTLTNRNEVTRAAETIQLVTTDIGNSGMLYSLGVAPSNEFNSYRSVFNRILGSLRLTQ